MKILHEDPRFTDSPIIATFKQAKDGSPAPKLCREYGIGNATFYKWRSKFVIMAGPG